MKFLLQTVDGIIVDIEVFNAKKLIELKKFQHSYVLTAIEDVTALESYKEFIPIGTIDFVAKWLNYFFGVTHMYPIEVPNILRIDKYLKRSYNIIKKESIPTDGYWFLKYVSKLKYFTCTSNLDWVSEKASNDVLIEGLYVVSGVLDILSEYRVFVSDWDIEAIQYYDGDCTVFPDIVVLKEMILLYSNQNDRPKSYTMDIAVSTKGTVILEIHPVTSCGTYGYTSPDLLYMYRDGVDYYKSKYNVLLSD